MRSTYRATRRARPLAELIEACLGKVVAQQGFANADILVSWPEIVGERLGRLSQPIKVDWPRRPRDGAGTASQPGTLVVRTDSAAALELQHLAPVVIERVNAFYGWRCVGRVVLKQAPVGRGMPARARLRELAPAERQRVAEALSGIEEADLRRALDRLGSALLASSAREAGDRALGHGPATIATA